MSDKKTNDDRNGSPAMGTEMGDGRWVMEMVEASPDWWIVNDKIWQREQFVRKVHPPLVLILFMLDFEHKSADQVFVYNRFFIVLYLPTLICISHHHCLPLYVFDFYTFPIRPSPLTKSLPHGTGNGSIPLPLLPLPLHRLTHTRHTRTRYIPDRTRTSHRNTQLPTLTAHATERNTKTRTGGDTTQTAGVGGGY